MILNQESQLHKVAVKIRFNHFDGQGLDSVSSEHEDLGTMNEYMLVADTFQERVGNMVINNILLNNT